MMTTMLGFGCCCCATAEQASVVVSAEANRPKQRFLMLLMMLYPPFSGLTLSEIEVPLFISEGLSLRDCTARCFAGKGLEYSEDKIGKRRDPGGYAVPRSHKSLGTL
jgi:hypothetical protein